MSTLTRLRPALSFLVAFASLALHCDSGGDGARPDAGQTTGPGDTGHADVGDATAAPGDSGSSTDAGDPGPSEGALTPTPTQPGVSPDGASVDQASALGEVRAGRITAADTGFTGIWSHCRTGDFKLQNEHLSVCVQGLTTNLPLTFGGGGLVDAKRAGFAGEELFESMSPRIGFNVMHPEAVRVVRDGTDGQGAVLRVEGSDQPIAYLIGALGGSLFKPEGLKSVTEYRLFPGREHIEIVTWWENPGPGSEAGDIGDLLSFGDRLRTWRTDAGFSTGSPGSYRWIGAFGLGQSFGWAQPGEASTVLPTDSFGSVPWIITKREQERLEPGEIRAQLRYFLVGDGSMESIRRTASSLVGEALAGEPVTVRVVDTAGVPSRGRLVELRRDAQSIALDVTDDAGEVSLSVEPGSYEIVVEGLPGEGEVITTAELSATEQAEVEVALPGWVAVRVVDEAGAPLTAQVRLRGPAGAPNEHSVVARQGVASASLAPGTWRVVANKGAEWDFAAADVEIRPGEHTELTLELVRSVDTAGWIGGDFHQHMEPSPDSQIHIEDRVLDNAAQGVEFFAATDHDVVTDLRPIIDQLGLGGELDTTVGVELSPLVSHVGVYPLPYDPDTRGRGTISLGVLEEGQPRQRMIPEVIEAARAMSTNPMIQLHHARSSSGLFDSVSFDPEVDPTSFIGQGHFTLDFDSMEIINRFDDTCRLFRDWSGLLNAGYRKTGLGNSDSHDLWGDAGVPRNFMRIASEAGDVTIDEVRAAMTSGQVSVGSNGFIDFADGKLPGDVIRANAREDVSFRVRVQTPNWSLAERLVVVVNGQIVDEIVRSATAGEGPVDFDQPLTYGFAEDSWIVFMAWGPRTSGEGGNDQPVVLFTNPVYVDIDGDADSDGDPWEAPGMRALALEGLDTSGVCR